MRVSTLRAVTALHRVVFDVTRGRVLGSIVGMPVYKVTTRGRRSGEPRDTMLTAPVVDGDRVVLVASYGGHPTHPQWYENMLADPRIVLTGGGRRREVVVRTANAAERAELWPRVEAAYDGYRAYQARTDREIPLVICE
jgi:deazaflavin-dependent oxidoreductase (nitroreductase family)